MLKIESREYKMMLDPGRYSRPKDGLRELHRELDRLADGVGVAFKRRFKKPDRREIVFLDTRDHQIRAAGFIVRERREGKKVEYTLKCRSPDRYVSAGARVKARKGLRANRKFEDDVAPPFVSRFSRSNTVGAPAGFQRPSTVRETARLFPGIKKLGKGDAWRQSALEVVRGFTAFERVYKGPVFRFIDAQATAAVILWQEEPAGPPVIAEFSFRCEAANERFSSDSARAAKTLFEVLQTSKLFAPESMTKTEFAYRGSSRSA